MMLKLLKSKLNLVLKDIRGEYRFSVKGYEIIATFAEKPNAEILPRIKEILLGDSHIRQSGTPNIKINPKVKEAV